MGVVQGNSNSAGITALVAAVLAGAEREEIVRQFDALHPALRPLALQTLRDHVEHGGHVFDGRAAERSAACQAALDLLTQPQE
jgi:hypothetical protein